MIALLDTNVLIRFLTCDKTSKFKGVYGFFESLERGDLQVEMKLIVLFQAVFVLKSFYAVPIDEIANGMLTILEYKGIVMKEKRIVRRTLTLWGNKKQDIVDCYLIACLEKDKQSILYSYDRDFDKFQINREQP